MSFKNSRNLFLRIFVLTCTFSTISAQEPVPCPPDDLIAPCNCLSHEIAENYFRCTGPAITQSSINNFFSTLRSLNNLSESDWLDLHSLRIGETFLSTLDLTPLLKSRSYEIFIESNPDLRTVLFDSSSSNVGQIETTILHIDYNNISDVGFHKTLTLFTPAMKWLDLGNNLLTGGQYEIEDGSGDVEFLPGLSALVNLEHLSLSYNQISRLGGGQFKRNIRLTMFTLSSNNLEGLEDDAILLDSTMGIEIQGRVISFGFNKLSDDKIHSKHGLDSWLGSTTVQLDFFNQFESISRVNWEGFLHANNHSNVMDVSYNILYCDDRMSWIRDGRADYEDRVIGAICENDYPNTIFTTQLDFSKPNFHCPTATTITPCSCDEINSQLHSLTCEGSEVTQDMIVQLYSVFRAANNVSTTQLVNVDTFSVEKTSLTEIDLSPLLNTQFNKIVFENNPNLVRILGTVNDDDMEKINATSIFFNNNNLTDEGLEGTFTSFSNDLKILNLDHNQLMGGHFVVGDGSGDVEFLHGLSSFTNLETLSIAFNKIGVLGGGQFRRMSMRVNWLDLSNNEIYLLDDEALTIGNENYPAQRFLRLSFNQLTDTQVHSNHGLGSWSGSTTVDLNYNKFESLSVANWENYLLGNDHSNIISFYSNQFFCNATMKWLKDGRDDFEQRVRFVDCTNDVGHNIFTTDLV